MSSENVVTENQQKNVAKRFVRKPGKTLLVKPLEDKVDVNLLEAYLAELTGFKDKVKTKTGSYFVVFNTLEDSANGLKSIRKEFNEVLVKYSHYRVFFTMKGLSEESDYNEVKKNHIKYVEDNTDGSVLYYKIYRGDDGYIGCGDLTLDTKEAMDSLLDSEQFKSYNFTGYEGLFYRFNKKDKRAGHDNETAILNA